MKEQLLLNIAQIYRQVVSLWNSMTTLQKIIAIIIHLILTTIGILFLIYSHRIFEWLGPVAKEWRELPAGWLILWAAIFFTAFPPIIGYSTCLTIAGFVWGMKGWLICASANVLGSLASFIASRTILSKYVHRLVGEDKRFKAFALCLKHDGLKILVMIRLCPLPYSLSNAALSTFPGLHPGVFTLATACATPKLLIHVFIGSRLASLAESGGKMDMGTKIVNYISIIGGAVLGAVVGYVIYNRTVERARQLEEEENQALVDTPGFLNRGEYFEDEEAEVGLANAGDMNDDDISLWGNDDEYRDDWTDEESGQAGNKRERLSEEETVIGELSSKNQDP
jgi:uncharacterized membrane protein YdjX (TVP38/TMEM64 family)